MNNFYNEESIFRKNMWCPHCGRMQMFYSTGLMNINSGVEFACSMCGYLYYLRQCTSALGYKEYGEL